MLNGSHSVYYRCRLLEFVALTYLALIGKYFSLTLPSKKNPVPYNLNKENLGFQVLQTNIPPRQGG